MKRGICLVGSLLVLVSGCSTHPATAEEEKEVEIIDFTSVEAVEAATPIEPPLEIVEEQPEPVEVVEEIIEEVVEAEIVTNSLGMFELTAYCSCEQCCGQYALNRPIDEFGNPIVYTATGAVAKAGVTIAVDPNVIAYGTVVEINGHNYIAQDTGGAIVGNRIDVYFDDHNEALQFGRQQAEVFLAN